jgi:hypothetical protein
MGNAVATVENKNIRFVVSNLIFSGKRSEFTTKEILSELDATDIDPDELSLILLDFCKNGLIEKVGSFFALAK